MATVPISSGAHAFEQGFHFGAVHHREVIQEHHAIGLVEDPQPAGEDMAAERAADMGALVHEFASIAMR